MLQKLGFLPGFNKQVTSTGAESQWTGGQNVRFRYGTPEKIGGWQQLGDKNLTGAARGLHHFVNTASNCFSTTNNDPTVTITFPGTHSFSAGDIILFGDATTFSSITNSNFTATDFADKKFMVTSVPTNTSITITMPTNETGSGYR